MNTPNKKPVWRDGQGKATGAVRHVYFSTSGKPVAILCGRTLQKRVRASLHQLRKPPAWCIDAAILEAARRDGARDVEVLDVETRRIYRAAVETFDRFGFRFDRGFGEQIGLALNHWHVEPEGVKQLALEF